MKRSSLLVFAMAAMALFMTGCSSMRVVDSDVTAFYNWNGPPPAPATPYRFERLPSQQAVGSPHDAVEGLARTALAKVGMELNPPAARYSVQVVANTQIVDRGPYGYGPYGGFGFGSGVFLGGGSRGASVGMSFPIGGGGIGEPPFFKRDLSIVMRDLRTNQVAFETRALHDGVWGDTLAVLPAMLDSALRGFPQPPPGTRRVNVEIPR
jgi:predicted small secreted protein